MDDPAREQRNNPPIAFKPREFVLGLIVAVAIVFAVAGSRWFVRARTTSSASTCQAHLKQLQAAKDGWALDNHKRAEDLPDWTNIIAQRTGIPRMPVCPKGGTYTLGPVGTPPRCSIPEHVLVSQ